MALLNLLQPTAPMAAAEVKAGSPRTDDEAASMPFARALERSRAEGDPHAPASPAAPDGPNVSPRAGRNARTNHAQVTHTPSRDRREQPASSEGIHRLPASDPTDGTTRPRSRRTSDASPQEVWSADPMAAQALVAHLTMHADAGTTAVAPPMAPAAPVETTTTPDAGCGNCAAQALATGEPVPASAFAPATPLNPATLPPVTTATAASAALPGAASLQPAQTATTAPATPRLGPMAATPLAGEPVSMPARTPDPGEDPRAMSGAETGATAGTLARTTAAASAGDRPEANAMPLANQVPTAPTPSAAAAAALRPGATDAAGTAALDPVDLSGPAVAALTAPGVARHGMSRADREAGRSSVAGGLREKPTTPSVRASAAKGDFASAERGADGALRGVAADEVLAVAAGLTATSTDTAPVRSSSPTPPATVVATAGPIASGNPGPAAMPSARMPEPTQVTLPVPLDSPAFAPALGAQVTLLVRAGIEQARIELNPAEMGPVAVQIALDGGGARIDFHAEVAATRQAIEASLPSLASALHDAGLTLTGGGVFQHPQRQAPSEQAIAGAGPRSGDTARGDDRATEVAVRPLARRGLVDLVA